MQLVSRDLLKTQREDFLLPSNLLTARRASLRITVKRLRADLGQAAVGAERGRVSTPTLQTVNRILVVEDFAPFRVFVSSLLHEKLELREVYEASDGLEAVQRAQELNPDLILMDIGLPKLNGIDAARQIRGSLPHSKILFLTQESSDEVVQEALRLGALGYVHKPRAGRDLLAALEAVLQGLHFVSSGLSGA